MLKTLFYTLAAYRLKLKMHFIEAKIKHIESLKYMNLQTRMELTRLKKMLTSLHEYGRTFQQSDFIINGMQKH